jgi:hypothetical protein
MNKELHIDSDMNFAAEVSSVFHLLCALSFANKISKGKFVKGIIFVRNHYIENEPIKEQLIEFENMKIELLSFKDNYKNINLIGNGKKGNNSKNELFYLLSVKVPNLNMYNRFKKSTEKKICVVLIDEGTGTYYNFSGAVYPIKTFFKKIIIFLNLSKVHRYFFLKKNGNKVIPNGRVIQDLIEVIGKYNEKYPVESANKYLNSNEKYVILISGLFIEMGLITLEEYIKKMQQLKNIIEEKRIKLLIKPYQSESLEKYKGLEFEILPWDTSCEALFPVIKPVFTLGFFSTSMITGKVMFGINSIDISDIFGLNNDVIFSKKYNRTFKFFEDYIFRADSFKSLDKLIDSIQRN